MNVQCLDICVDCDRGKIMQLHILTVLSLSTVSSPSFFLKEWCFYATK